jgi:flagellar basal body-associated protein FliL
VVAHRLPGKKRRINFVWLILFLTGGTIMLRTIITLAAVVAAVVAFVFAKQHQAAQPAPRVDVCAELREIEARVDQVSKYNHRLRVRMPHLRNDRDSCGVTLELVSVYGAITDAERKLGCR